MKGVKRFDSIEDASKKYPDLGILQDENELWNLLLYLDYTQLYFRGSPVHVIMSRYGLTYEEVIVLAEILQYDMCDSVSGEMFLVTDNTRKATIPEIHKDSFATSIVDHAIKTETCAGSILNVAQSNGTVPISLSVEAPFVMTAITKGILETDCGYLDMDGLAKCSRSNVHPLMLIEREFFYCSEGDAQYYIDPTNFLILTESDMERMEKLNTFYSVTMLSQVLAIPESIVRLLLSKRVTAESLIEKKLTVNVARRPEPMFKKGVCYG